MSEIYFDNASTTRLDPQVIDAMVSSFWMPLGNASSLHKLGVKAATQIELARQQIAARVGAQAEEIFFTGSGTESNHLALIGYCLANRSKGDHVIVSSIEHSSLLGAADWLSRQGFRVTRLEVDAEARVRPEELREKITDRTLLVSIMHANNEVGTIQDLEGLGAICSERGVSFHTDACQSFTKVPLDVRRQRVDLMTLSAHKIHGPRGTAALFIRKGVEVEPLLRGGGQESGIRSGTYNTEAIIGFGAAVKAAELQDAERMAAQRDELIRRLCSEISGVALNGPRTDRLCNNVNVTIRGVSSKRVLFGLDKLGIFVSVGSACASGKKSPSHVLLAMGRDPVSATESLRISLSKWTTAEEIDRFVRAFADVVAKERASHVSHTA